MRLPRLIGSRRVARKTTITSWKIFYNYSSCSTRTHRLSAALKSTMITNKYIKAISYNFAYFLVSSLAYLVLTPIAIRVMGGEFYGLWMILFAVGQFSLIGTLGIESIVNKFASEVQDGEDRSANILSSAIVIVFTTALLVAIALLIFRNLLAESIHPSTGYLLQFKNALAVYALVIIPQFVIRVFHGFFLSQILNRFARTMDLLNSLLPLLGGVLLSLFVKDLFLLAMWNLVVSLLVLVLYIMRTRRVIRLHWLPTRATIRRMLGFSGFMFIESAAITLFQQFDRLLVALTLGATALGAYSVATGVGLRLSIIAGSITEVLVPYASRKQSLGEKTALEVVVQKVSRYISLIAALVGGLLIIWMKELLAVWISPQYAEANTVLFCIIILAYSVLSLSRPAHQTLIGLGKVKITSMIYLVASVLMLAVLYLLSRQFGLIGAGLANLVMLLLLGMNLFLLRWFDRGQVWRSFTGHLAMGVLPLVLAFLLVKMGVAWPYRLIYSAALLALVLTALVKDPDFVLRVKQMVGRMSSKGNDPESGTGV